MGPKRGGWQVRKGHEQAFRSNDGVPLMMDRTKWQSRSVLTQQQLLEWDQDKFYENGLYGDERDFLRTWVIINADGHPSVTVITDTTAIPTPGWEYLAYIQTFQTPKMGLLRVKNCRSGKKRIHLWIPLPPLRLSVHDRTMKHPSSLPSIHAWTILLIPGTCCGTLVSGSWAMPTSNHMNHPVNSGGRHPPAVLSYQLLERAHREGRWHTLDLPLDATYAFPGP